MKLCILDTVGCGILGSKLPWGKILTEYFTHIGGKKEASIWGTDSLVPIENAAFANGTFIHGFEADDLHKRSILHPGAVTLPVVVGYSQLLENISGKQFMTAMIAGYEVGTRIGSSVGTDHLHLGFHPTGTNGTFSAAAAAANILGLNEEKTIHSLGIAGTQAAGLMASQYSAMVKRMHAGRAAQSGVYAARLAERGFTGITDIIEASYGGYSSTFAREPDMDVILADLGSKFEAEQIGFKPYCCCGSAHTTLDAIREIKARRPNITAENVKEIKVYSTTATKLHVGWPYTPDSVTTAQMNLSYCAAVMFLDNEVFVKQFTEDRLKDPKVLDLVEKIKVIANPEFDKQGSSWRHAVKVIVELDDSTTEEVEVQSARGSMSNPLSENEVINKYQKLASEVLNADELNILMENIFNLDKYTQAIDVFSPILKSKP